MPPSVDWQAFRALPGPATHNWELLCRELVRRHYERYGVLRARRQQPGVEFRLIVEQSCDLGDPGRHWGWQCRWYETSSGLTAGRRREIEKAIATTARHLPDLTDWVLWIRDPLTKGDEEWLTSLEAPFAIRNWDEQTVAGLLDGPARSLAQTYLGERTLSEDDLAAALREAMAPVRHRYERDLHIVTAPERRLERWFLGSDLVAEFQNHALDLQQVLAETIAMADPRRRRTTAEQKFVDDIAHLTEGLHTVAGLLEEGGLREAAERCEGILARFGGNRAKPVRAAVELLAEVYEMLAQRALAVVGAAGTGKTHLAVELADGDLKGVLWLGSQFGRTIPADALAIETTLSPRTREELLEALDAHAQRTGHRLPMVIDGLNESQDPRAWKNALARLIERLRDFSHLFLIVMVRPTYVDETLPEGIARIALAGFELELDQAVNRYLDFFRIRVDRRLLPMERFREPLFLRIFCEAANHERRPNIAIEHIPVTLAEVFQRYIRQVLDGIQRRLDIDPGVLRDALDAVALELWTNELDRLPATRARKVVGDDARTWSGSVLRALESEEILVRESSHGTEHVTFSYDRLTGHAIAEGMLRRQEQLQDIMTCSHRLVEDVVVGLTGLMPDYRGAHLWPLLKGPWRTFSLLELPGLPAHHLSDPASPRALGELFHDQPREVLVALRRSAFIADHPLNAGYLHELLVAQPLRRRDGEWSILLVDELDRTSDQLHRWQEPWSKGITTAGDHPAARWAAWVLASPHQDLRRHAHHALRTYGRLHPRELIGLAEEFVVVNDPWVVHGLLGLAYEIAADDQAEACGAELRDLAERLIGSVLVHSGEAATADWLVRELSRRLVATAGFPVPQPPHPRPPDPPPITSRPKQLMVALALGDATVSRLLRLAGVESAYRGTGKQIVDHFAAMLVALGWQHSTIFDAKYLEQALFATAGRIEDGGAIYDAVDVLAPYLDEAVSARGGS